MQFFGTSGFVFVDGSLGGRYDFGDFGWRNRNEYHEFLPSL